MLYYSANPWEEYKWILLATAFGLLVLLALFFVARREDKEKVVIFLDASDLLFIISFYFINCSCSILGT